ncbi:cytochrome P450 [Apiospora hydei]|uniref:Cytochrome P450 n=1 Tax=Apiospora hydei TaxID=1337664 RepID=A0ABR1WBD6_9PEZI
MATGFTFVLGFLGAAYVFFTILLRLTQHPKEPPAIAKTIPFISPLFGFVHGMQSFLVSLRDRYNLPIYTLRMPGQRVYVVNSLSLIPQVQKQIKTIAFAPIEAQAADAVMGVGPAGNAVIGSERMFENDSYLSTFVPSTQPALSPGPGLDALSGAAIRYISNAMEMVAEGGPTTIELFAWVRHEFFTATAEAIYGPKNPFRDTKLEQAWYLLARKGLHAREQLLIPAFEQYFAENGHLQGSVLVQCRYKHNTSHGLRGRDLAATEIGQMVASLANSIPAVFWLVYHIFSDPAVLSECREEAEQLVQADGDVDLAKVKSACPVLLSTWQETLRYMHIGISARVVMEDVILDNQYLLKKGATVIIPTPRSGGPTVGIFNHRRFLRTPGTKRAHNPAAFRAFGGGSVLCPGRHFVTTEAMSFATLMLLRFNMKPAARGGKWVNPRKSVPMTTSVPTPKDAVQVRITPRDNKEYHVHFSASKKGFDLVAEDITAGNPAL